MSECECTDIVMVPDPKIKHKVLNMYQDGHNKRTIIGAVYIYMSDRNKSS